MAGSDDGEARGRVFSQLKPYCLELLELLSNPSKKHSDALVSLLRFIRCSSSTSLRPFFDYTLFPLLLLLDAAVECRSTKKDDSDEGVPRTPLKISDSVAEGVLHCLEELLKKCPPDSVDQMVVVMKKLTYAALLSPSEASEEFREGVIKCFGALLLSLPLCSDEACSCSSISGLPALLEIREMQTSVTRLSKSNAQQGECLLAFLRSQNASAAVGHWLSLLLKAADTEATRGHRGSAKLRIEAFATLRSLVAKVGTADALAFFLPGVVSQFAKVLHVSKTMIAGAAGSAEATNQAIRGLAEYLMIVLEDNSNLSSLHIPVTFMDVSNSGKDDSVASFLDMLQRLPSKVTSEELLVEGERWVNPAYGNKGVKLDKEIGSLHIHRTGDWMEKTSANVNKLLSATFPHMCVHSAKKVRRGLLAAIEGLLSKCNYSLRESRLMLLECLCLLIVDDTEEVSVAAQEFLGYLFAMSRKNLIEHDFAQIFSRLIEKLPKVVLGNEESLALSHAQQLLVIIYYSGPQFVLDQLQSPVTAARFLDVFALCMSQNSVFTGALDKLVLARSSSVGYLQSITELRTSLQSATDYKVIMDTIPSDIPQLKDVKGKGFLYQSESMQNKYELPRMPPWFVNVGNQKLYEALAGILRLVGLSLLLADQKSEGYLSIVTDIPLGYLRKLISEVRVKEYNRESWQSWYRRSGSGQILRQASTAVCILNEMIFGLSDQAVNNLTNMFMESKLKGEDVIQSDARVDGCFPSTLKHQELAKPIWVLSQEKASRIHLIECIGRILHEYLSSEVWDLPIDNKSFSMESDDGFEEISLPFICDTAMLHQVVIDGIGVFATCLGEDFASSGFLHSSLYLLLENLICSEFRVRNASDAVLHIVSATCGYPTVGHFVLANADYVIDSVCQQLRHLELNPHVPNVLASMLSYIKVAHKILPLLEEPMRSASEQLEILGRHQHPELTIPFLKAVAEITKASKDEALLLTTSTESSYLVDIKSKISVAEREEDWESIVLEFNDCRRYRRTVGSIAGSCLTAATPLLASKKQAACLVALDIIEDGIVALAKVEEAYRHEKETKEEINEFIQSNLLYQHQDTLDASADDTDENRLLPAMNKLWPFLVTCIRNKNSVAVKRCLHVIGNVVQICGGDFFSRRFHTDGIHFWKILSTSPFHKRPPSKAEKIALQLPYRSVLSSSEDTMAEVSNLKVQISVLNMIADLSRNKRSATALHVVLKKVSGLVVGIACSGIAGLYDASANALHGLACIDPDLIWLLLADVYYSLKNKNLPSPPISDLPQMSQILPPLLSPTRYLHVQYAGEGYGFDVDFTAVESVFKNLHSHVFTNQMYI